MQVYGELSTIFEPIKAIFSRIKPAARQEGSKERQPGCEARLPIVAPTYVSNGDLGHNSIIHAKWLVTTGVPEGVG